MPNFFGFQVKNDQKNETYQKLKKEGRFKGLLFSSTGESLNVASKSKSPFVVLVIPNPVTGFDLFITVTESIQYGVECCINERRNYKEVLKEAAIFIDVEHSKPVWRIVC